MECQMRTLTSDLFISLDGFAAGENVAAYFGYDGPDLSAWIQTEICKPQVLLMGRSTYVVLSEVLATATDPISTEMQALPKLVLSSTLSTPLAWSNTHLLRGEVLQQIRSLKQQPGDPIRSIGSLQLVRSLMTDGLIDCLRLMVFPLLLGEAGREPVYAGIQRTALRLVETRVLDSRVVLLEYAPEARVAQ
jgi:dihydrofolate reductase